MSQDNYFRQTIEHLRHYEEILLFANLHSFSKEEQQETCLYLQREYDQELIIYPHQLLPFDNAAALWAAQTVYVAAQLMLYRENKEADLEALLPVYPKAVDAAAMLSADLVLRFLPDILLQLKTIDPDDKLISILEAHLKTWHYSAVGYTLPVEELIFEPIAKSPCLLQLYAERVAVRKVLSLAKHPALALLISASLGIYAPLLWKDFKQEQLA